MSQGFDQPQRSMDDVVAYLDRQEHVEVLKRIKLGGTRPFTADGRSVGEIVVVAVEEGKAQRLRASAPPDLFATPTPLPPFLSPSLSLALSTHFP